MNYLNYQKLLNEIPIGWAYLKIYSDEEGKPYNYEILYINSAFETLTGLKASKAVQNKIDQVFPEINNDTFDWLSIFKEAALYGKIVIRDCFSRMFNHCFNIKVYSPEKDVLSLFLAEISSETYWSKDFNDFVNDYPDMLCISDDDGVLIRVNNEWENVLGFKRQEMEGKRFFDFIHPDDIDKTRDIFDKQSKRTILKDFVNRYRYKDGSYRYLDWWSKPKDKLVYAVARDVTDRVRENMLLERLVTFSEEFLQMSSDKMDYQKITDNLMEITGAKYVIFNLYEDNNKEYMTISVSAPDEDIKKASQLLGSDIAGGRWKNNQRIEVDVNRNISIFNSLGEYAGNTPVEVTEKLQNTFSIGQVVRSKIVKDQEFLGDFLIIMPKGTEFKNENLVSIYSRQVGMLIERIRSEEALRLNEAQLKEIQSISCIGRWEKDVDSNLIFVSDCVKKTFEIDGEFTHDQFLERIHTDDREKVCKIEAEHKKSGDPQNITYRIKQKNGEIKWINQVFFTGCDLHGHPCRLLGTMQDVTKLKESEEKIRKLLEENETVFNGTQDALFLVRVDEGPSFRYIKNNVSHQHMTGFPPEIFEGKTPQELVGLQMGETIHNNYKRCIQERKTIIYEETLELPGGLRTWVTTLTPVFDNGDPIYIVGSSHDITERKKAEKAIKESEERFRMLVECAPDAIFIPSKGKFLYVNEAAVTLFGAKSKKQLIGTNVIDRFHPEHHEIIFKRIRLVQNEKKYAPPLEEVYLRLDGTPVHVDVSAVPVTIGDSHEAIIFVRDISERKKLQEIEKEMEIKFRQQQKLEAIGTLAGGVAHEINNPINGIMNYAQLILDSVKEGTHEAEFAGEIVHETERVTAIVKSLLQFSRQEKHEHSFAKIDDIINQTVSLVKALIKKDQINLIVDIEEGLPHIKCRSQQIQQVLMNLLTNARDALNDKYLQYDENKIIRLRCRKFTNEKREWIRITVEDYGNGIPQEIQGKIFEPFYSTKPRDKGTGLGLSISFGIVKDHHGMLTVKSRKGEYTCFNIDLPVDNGWTT